jgi:hypothetical protein
VWERERGIHIGVVEGVCGRDREREMNIKAIESVREG